MDLSPSPVGLFVVSAGACVFGTCLGYIAYGNDYGRPWLPSLVGGLGFLVLTAGVVLAQLL